MGNTHIHKHRKKMLSVFNNQLERSMGRSLLQSPFRGRDPFLAMNQAFDQMHQEMHQARESFLHDMDVDPDQNGLPTSGGSQTYYSSSSTFQSGNGEPVNQTHEVFRGPDGRLMSEPARPSGDKRVIERVRDGEEIRRDLHNMEPEELEAFQALVQERSRHSLPAAPPASPRAAEEANLPDALQHDLSQIQLSRQ